MSEVRLNLCCRLCLKDSFSLVNIFSHRSPSGELVHRILDFVYDLKVSQEDGLPSQICSPCLWRLTEFEEYKKNVHHAEAEIMKLISKVTSESNGVPVNEENNQLERESEDLYSDVADDVRESNFIWIKNEIQSEDTEVPIKEEIDIAECEIPEETAVRENMKEVLIKEEIDIVDHDFPQETAVGENIFESISVTNIHSSQCFQGIPEVGVDFSVKESYTPDVSQAEIADEGDNPPPLDGKINYVCDSTSVTEINSSRCLEGIVEAGFDFCVKESNSLDVSLTETVNDGTNSPPLGGKKNCVCDVCGKSFTVKRTMGRHSPCNTNARPYPCTDCRQHFKALDERSTHEGRHLRGELNNRVNVEGKSKNPGCRGGEQLTCNLSNVPENFSCDLCGNQYMSRSGLTKHMRTHLNIRPFTCPVCGKSFYQSSTLKEHMYTHTTEEPFSCSFCKKKFKSKKRKRRHELLHLE